MFYKKEDTGVWTEGRIIILPDGKELNEINKLELNGWQWSDEPPTEYTEWLNSQNASI